MIQLMISLVFGALLVAGLRSIMTDLMRPLVMQPDKRPPLRTAAPAQLTQRATPRRPVSLAQPVMAFGCAAAA